jgi:hypothetical protein
MTPGWWNGYAVHTSERRVGAAKVSPKRLTNFGKALSRIVVCRRVLQQHQCQPISKARCGIRLKSAWKGRRRRAAVFAARGTNTKPIRGIGDEEGDRRTLCRQHPLPAPPARKATVLRRASYGGLTSRGCSHWGKTLDPAAQEASPIVRDPCSLPIVRQRKSIHQNGAKTLD